MGHSSIVWNQLSPVFKLATNIPAAYIEGHQPKVLQAKQCLADRLAQKNLINQRDSDWQEASNLKKKIDTLLNAQVNIEQEINCRKTKEQKLLKELKDVRSAIIQEEQKLTHLPEMIKKIKEDLATKIRNTKALSYPIQKIPL